MVVDLTGRGSWFLSFPPGTFCASALLLASVAREASKREREPGID